MGFVLLGTCGLGVVFLALFCRMRGGESSSFGPSTVDILMLALLSMGTLLMGILWVAHLLRDLVSSRYSF